MFLERVRSQAPGKGWIEVICGSMFSGKTEELIRRLRRAEFARQKVEIFKPAVDTRYAEHEVVSHDATSIRSTPVPGSNNLLLLASDIDVVGIDEAQFFDEGLAQVCAQLADNGVRVIAAGLDMDFQGRPFGPMPQLMAMAEHVTKVHAICVHCGQLASFSHRTHASTDLIHLGETDSYVPLCRGCFGAARQEQVTAARDAAMQR
ncbi:MAG: thymidine kinase [Flavobacteriales bacterium]|nr:Thymidine kinase [Flavobacteriales bacterium]MCC6578190.1 thymidine kinase [Flavobacteriales bacterium]NUQ14692.1 thymidine kinase [Flavobacteriales bacterium]